MILHDAKGNTYSASKVKRPRLWSPLRCWDIETRSFDGKPFDMFLERGWGKAFYFEVNHQWYRLPFLVRGDFTKPDAFDVPEFFSKPLR